MFTGLLSYYEGGTAGPFVPELAQAPFNTASGAKRFVLPREMAESAKRLGTDGEIVIAAAFLMASGVLQ